MTVLREPRGILLMVLLGVASVFVMGGVVGVLLGIVTWLMAVRDGSLQLRTDLWVRRFRAGGAVGLTTRR